MIWLIGNKGMLGTEISRQLTENKIDFVGTDIDVDITNIDALKGFASGKGINWIINCAAYTAVDNAETNVELAKKVDADGIHVGQNDMAAQDVRAIIGPDKILGVSTQTVEEALLAQKMGADYLGVGAVFPTSFD